MNNLMMNHWFIAENGGNYNDGRRIGKEIE